jgi:hypothetical protein
MAALLLRVTAIDGAVLIEPHAAFVSPLAILDGLATPQGDRARGARYSSSVCYLWETALPRGDDLGRTVPWNGSPAARIWRIVVRAAMTRREIASSRWMQLPHVHAPPIAAE